MARYLSNLETVDTRTKISKCQPLLWRQKEITFEQTGPKKQGTYQRKPKIIAD